MINVSSAWKAAHKQTILPETFVEIIMDAFDPDVSSNVMQVEDTPSATFSNSEAIVNSTSYPTQGQYALLEQNLWLLDGSKKIVSDVNSYSATGYVSEEDATGALTVYTSTAQENGIPGFTIVWSAEYDEYATDFVVTVYNGSTVVATTTVSDNDSSTSVVPLQITTPYTRVGITIKAWNTPNHRKRIDSLCYGFHWVFDKDEIISYTHEQSGDLLSAEVSRNEIVFSLDNSQDIWNPINPQGLGQYLSEQQKVTVRYGMDVNGVIEWILGGTFYLTEWNASPNGLEANFAARDALGLLENVLYSRDSIDAIGYAPYIGSGTIYKQPDPQAETLNEKVVTGEEYLVYDRVMGVVWTTGEYVNMYKIALKSNPNAKQGWTPHAYLTEHYDAMSREALLTSVLSNVDLPDGFEISVPSDVEWVLEVPIKIDQTPVSEIIQMLSNSLLCRHRMDRNGVLHVKYEKDGLELSDYDITLDFVKIYPEVSLTKPVGQIYCMTHPVGESERDIREQILGRYGSGITVTVDNRLITSLSSLDLVYWINDVHRHRTVISGEFRADPRLDLFDVVKVETKYGYVSPVVITKIKYTFSGTFWATFEGRVIDL